MPINDKDYEVLRRYLLDEPPRPSDELLDRLLETGELPELPGPVADRLALERRLLEDRELFELALAVEDELVEACARGELPELRCRRLMERLAASPAGRERLAMYQALKRTIPVRPVQPLTVPLPFVARVRHYAAAWRPALAAALLVAMLGGAGWFVREEIGKRRHEATATHPTPQEPAETGGGEVRPPSGRPEEDIANTETTGTEPPQVHEIVATVLYPLALSMVRDEEVTVKPLAAGPATKVTIRADMGTRQPFPAFRAVIKSMGDGEARWSSGPEGIAPEADRATLLLHLPAGVLTEGKYKLMVHGVTEGGEVETIGGSEFEVVVP